MAARRFRATVSALSSFNRQLEEADAALEEVRTRLVRHHASITQPPPSDYDGERHKLCKVTLAAAEECASVEELQAHPCFEDFVQVFHVHPRMLQRGDLGALCRFIGAKERQESEASAAERAAGKALAVARQAAEASAEVSEAQAAAAAQKQAAIAQSRRCLAASDHLPIRAEVVVGDGRVVRVSSHNVQEHVRDGLQTYVCALPFVAGTRGCDVSGRLIAAMMAPEVLAQQVEDTVGLIDAELHRGADAVCLQEVTVPLLAALRAAATPHGWAVHACAAERLQPTLAEGQCIAITCVVTMAASGALAAPDVVVEARPACPASPDPRVRATVASDRADPRRPAPIPTQVQQKTKVNRRAFAAVVLPGGTHIVSTHVRHSQDRGPAQASNADNIRGAQLAIVRTFWPALAKGCTLVAVGDFNGPLRGNGQLEGAYLRRRSPAEPTQLDKPLAVDGAVAFAASGASRGAPMTCCVLPAEPDEDGAGPSTAAAVGMGHEAGGGSRVAQ